MDKELVQRVINMLTPSNPKSESFERALVDLLDKYEKPRVRLYCEIQSVIEEDVREN